jgi:hypothetical protein
LALIVNNKTKKVNAIHYINSISVTKSPVYAIKKQNQNFGKIKMTPKEIETIVEQELYKAGATQYCMPNHGLSPAGYRSYWPEFTHDPGDYSDEDAKNKLPVPSSKDITHMDRWLNMAIKFDCDPLRRKVVQKRIVSRPGEKKKSWRIIGEEIGCSHENARRQYKYSVSLIARIASRRGLIDYQ